MKKIVAVRPDLYNDGMHFMNDAFEGWKEIGGTWKNHWWQPRPLHYFFYRYDIPFSLPQSKKEARLMFVCASTLKFCTYGDYVRYEIVPMKKTRYKDRDTGEIKFCTTPWKIEKTGGGPIQRQFDRQSLIDMSMFY